MIASKPDNLVKHRSKVSGGVLEDQLEVHYRVKFLSFNGGLSTGNHKCRTILVRIPHSYPQP